jgi:4-amino-4-deoxy-L-arabinose transferase
MIDDLRYLFGEKDANLDTLLCLLIFSIGCSILFHFKGKSVLSVLLAILASAMLYRFAISLDVFLNLWDERFHALVASNLLKHPLMPTLYDSPVVEMAYDRWDRGLIWLHKQPLFLWQIAVSFKLFGISEVALRLPSAAMGVVLTLLTWRTGKVLVNDSVGYYAAILLMSSYYLFEMIAGRQSTDHNDVAFLFYVSASIWAWVEYEYSPEKNKIRWAVLVGAISGAAILCKWLVGLSVYVAWGLSTLPNEGSSLKNRLNHYFIASLATLIVALPWQILTYSWYPAEASFELHYNARHFTQALEGHSGDMYYHLDNFTLLFGRFSPFFLFAGIFAFVRGAEKRGVALAFLGIPFVIYLFYSVAETKMLSYPFVAAMPIFICFGSLLDSVVLSYKQCKLIKKIWLPLSLCTLGVVVWMNLRVSDIVEAHKCVSGDSSYSARLTENRNNLLRLKDELPANAILFNVPGRHYVEAMFYTGHLAYGFIPDQGQVARLVELGYLPIILHNGDGSLLPDWVHSSASVELLLVELHSYG